MDKELALPDRLVCGQVVFTGAPATLVTEGETVTARHPREYVAGCGQVGGDRPIVLGPRVRVGCVNEHAG